MLTRVFAPLHHLKPIQEARVSESKQELWKGSHNLVPNMINSEEFYREDKTDLIHNEDK